MKRIIMLIMFAVVIILSSSVVVYAANYQIRDEFGMNTYNSVETKDNYSYTIKNEYNEPIGSYKVEPEQPLTNYDRFNKMDTNKSNESYYNFFK